MRMLHLVDVHSGCSGPMLHQAASSCIDSLAEHEHVVFEVGGGPRETVLGSNCAGRFPSPRSTRLAAASPHPISRVLEECDASGVGIDLVQSWGPDSTSLSATRCHGRHRVAMLDAFTMSPSWIRELRVASDMALCCTALGSARRLIASGMTAARVHHVPAAVDWPVSEDRAACRARWGAGERTMVLGVLDEPRGTAALRQITHVASRLGLLGVDMRLVVSPESSRLDDTRHWLQILGFPEALVLDEAIDRPWTVIDAIDAVVVGGGGRRDVDISGSAGLCLARSMGRSILLGSGHVATEEEHLCSDVFTDCDRDEDRATAWVRSRGRSFDRTTEASMMVDGLRELYRVFDAAATPASDSQPSGAVS